MSCRSKREVTGMESLFVLTATRDGEFVRVDNHEGWRVCSCWQSRAGSSRMSLAMYSFNKSLRHMSH